MRVGVDATSWSNPRGFGRFARHAVGRLAELDDSTTYVLYVDAAEAERLDLPAAAQRRAVRLRRSPSETLAAGASRSPSDLLRLARAAGSDGLDGFLFPSVLSYFPVRRIPLVVGVHDATAAEHPELVFPGRFARLAWRAKERSALRRAAALFTVSQSARRSIAAALGVPAEHLAVVGEAPAPVFSPREAAQRTAAAREVGLRDNQPFFLYAGGINPHKNLETLVAAYADLHRERGDVVPALVIAGALQDSYVSAGAAVRDQVAELALGDLVRLPGFVPDETLACLYSGALAVVIPSRAEGFGLPAVEAGACGAPVVLSDIDAHRETMGEAALYFPPTDRAALARQLGRLVDDEALRERLAVAAGTAAAGLSWDAVALRLRDVVAAATGRR
jgi:glycosyltransferase involved in cell wall biosynthesis